MIDILRWGRTAYETDEVLEAERRGAEALGLSWRLVPQLGPPESLEARVLVIPSKVRITAAVLGRFPGELIIATTSGFDHIDIEACRARGVVVLRLPGARREAVVEHALACLIGLSRRLPELERRASEGVWARGALPALAPRGLSGSTVAVIGLGVIGRRMATVLEGLGASVLGVDPLGAAEVDVVPLREALERADAVTIHCSLTPSSRDLVNAEALDHVPPHAVVVNTARGEVLDVVDALERVRRGRLRGLACDVFPIEPYPALASAAEVPGVWFTPHSAGYTSDLGSRVAEGVLIALGAWLEGQPLPDRVV